MTFAPTLMCVHAHPDDEAIFTAGVTSHYGDLGYRVVLITCTNGQLGFDDHGRPGSDPLHDVEATRAMRAGELQHAAAVAGFSRVVTLGYEDSGMKGWAQNDRPNAFMNADVDSVARTLASIMDEERAAVVVTYDENGFYGHPDHIMANVVTRAAISMSPSPMRLYYPVAPRGVLEEFVAGATANGVYLPAWILDATHTVADDTVATTMDVRAVAKRKHQAIAIHASQVDNADLVTMDEELFTLLFGIEYYQRAWSRDVTSGDETDLFGGL
ncbi:MAG: PIG-L family deacetylase [Acidimicrobiales bacterium]|jgi:LmbE family N-acetylglucosaminyl deacetylase